MRKQLETSFVQFLRLKNVTGYVPEVCHPHIYVDLHVTLESSSSLSEAHEIAHLVEDKLKSSIPEIEDVMIPVEGED